MPLALGRRAVAVLLQLVDNAGDVVTKDQLMDAGWGGMAVEESNLAVQISSLRRLIDPNDGPSWIETMPRRGYRFTGPVQQAPTIAATPTREAGRPSLAVLPFRVPEPNAVPHYLADGIAEAMVASLSGLADLTVISYGTTCRLRGVELDLQAVGRDLNVRYVATGSIRQSGNQRRITVELANAQSGAVLSARSYDMDREAPFDAQDRMVAQIIQALAPTVRAEELRRIRARRPDSLLAYELTLQARAEIYRLDRSTFDQSATLLARAIEIDPDYAAAHALMAEFHSLRYGQGWSENFAADGEAVARYANQAIDRDPTDARALAFLAHSKAFLQRDTDAALPLFERALDTAPNNAGAWMWSSVTHAYLGDGDEAVRRAQLALRLSPRDWFGFQFNTALCLAHYVAGAYDEAIRFGTAALAENPRYHSALRYTTAALAARSETGQAATLAQEMMLLEPSFRLTPLLAAHPFRDPDRRERYRRHLQAAGLPD